ncbi:MAG TPA: hypothetical protein VK699_05480 [Terriglobales bacterium]|jgi:hypothetical protein|nr:hypothetical protein [Terriglobales bacterium]
MASGARTQDVEIAVTTQALYEIRHAATKNQPADPTAADLTMRVVRGYMKQHLANPGASFWNPLLGERLEIAAATAEVMLWQIRAEEKSK